MSDSPRSFQEIDISVAGPYRQELSEGWLRMVMEAALAEALPKSEPVQVGLVVTDDETVRELNRRFRGLHEVTDVLSFPLPIPDIGLGRSRKPGKRPSNPKMP